MSCNWDRSPAAPVRRGRLYTGVLKAEPSLKNLAGGLERDTSCRIHVGRLE